ncbi:unnamed protein product [Calypogeia fissa]
MQLISYIYGDSLICNSVSVGLLIDGSFEYQEGQVQKGAPWLPVWAVVNTNFKGLFSELNRSSFPPAKQTAE